MVRQDRSTVTVRLVSLGASLILLSALVAACLIRAGQSLASANSLPQRPFSVAFDDTPGDGGASPTPTPTCRLYTYTLGDGTPIGGVHDIGNHCDFCGTLINLPFPVSMYGQTFITATVTSKGLLAFGFAHTAYNVECLPFSNSTYAMAPFWVDQWTATSVCPLCGIFTNTVGTAPNRTFIVEWRTLYFNQRDMPPTLNYEIQLQEGQSTFKYVYELVTSYNNADTSLTIGTQLSRNLDIYTEYYCDPTGETAPPLTGKQLTWVYDPCGTPIASATSTRTPTGTATPFTPGPTNTSGGCFDNGSVPVTCTPTPIVTNTATNTHTPLPTQTPGGPSATPEPSNTSTAEATVTPTICAISFTDVSEGHTFYPYIMCLACRDIISGYTSSCETGDPCFRPGNNVTRGQIAKIVSNAAGFNEPVTGQTFEDVPTGHTFYDFVERLASREVMSGYPCGSPGEPCNPPDNRPYFRPNGTATRGQLAKIVSNAAGFNEPVTGQTFEDIPPGHTFYDFIERLATRGVMSGYPCGGLAEPCVPPDNRPYFRPNANVTRGQTTKIVANTFFPECAPGR